MARTRNKSTATKVNDVVCGKEIDADTAMFSSNYQGKTYYFCSEICKRQFDDDPELFAGIAS